MQMWQCNLTEIEGNFTNSSLNVYVGDGCVSQVLCYYEWQMSSGLDPPGLLIIPFNCHMLKCQLSFVNFL